VKSSKDSPAPLSRMSQRSIIRDETELNRSVRSAIRARGLAVVHIRETDVPGATDLVIWKGTDIRGWMELKMNDEAVRKSQIEFMNQRRKESDRVYLGRFHTEEDMFTIWRWPDVFDPTSFVRRTQDLRYAPFWDFLIAEHNNV